jgi:hypothetical protein
MPWIVSQYNGEVAHFLLSRTNLTTDTVEFSVECSKDSPCLHESSSGAVRYGSLCTHQMPLSLFLGSRGIERPSHTRQKGCDMKALSGYPVVYR